MMTTRFDTSTAGSTAKARTLTGKAKAKHVHELLATLKDDLRSTNLSTDQRRAALEQLKIYGRDPKDAEPIFTKEGIEVLAKHGLTEKSSPSSLEALRCLANAMLLDPKTRQIFVNLGRSGQTAERLKNQDSDNEFLISRILFLNTYECELDFNPLFEKHGLGDSVNAHIARHAGRFLEGSQKNHLDPIDQAGLSESLKLLFNLITYYPHHTTTFTSSIENIFSILNKISIPNPALQPPINYLINALVNLDLSDRHHASYCNSNPKTIDVLTTILSQSLSTYQNPFELESLTLPLLTLLHKIHESAPPDTKQHMKSLLLPSETDRDLPLGQSDTLPSRLLRLSTSPAAPKLRQGISALMFELSGRDANAFVRNVGYGFAAGFLLAHGIAVPEAATGGQRTSGHGVQGEADGEMVNPITGQKLSKEEPVDMGPEMTTEEKEREAERLFVLFERLKATGVVDVKNPIREAVESGRFEEDGGRGGGMGVRRVEEIDDDDD